MENSKRRAADFVLPASPQQPPRKKTTIRISPIKPWPKLGLPYITHDLIRNILTRLPPRSVARFRSVCKDWLAAISDPGFLDAHLQAARKRPSLLMVPTMSFQRNGLPIFVGLYRYRVGDEAELIRFNKFHAIVCVRSTPVHCDGLILITANAEWMMIICNPATGEVVGLPGASIGVRNAPMCRDDTIRFASRAGLGFDPRGKKYKVARFFYVNSFGHDDPVCKFEVFTVGTDAWRRTADDPPYPIAGRTPAHVRGSIYWMLIDTTHWGFLRFSLADEKFSLVPCPPSDYEPARFVQSESELCCTCFCEQKRELEVWSLSVGRENPEWTRRCTVVITPDLVLFDFDGCPTRSPKVILHGRMLILAAERKVCRYDMQTSRMEEIGSEIHKRFHQENMVQHLTNYVESLVCINAI